MAASAVAPASQEQDGGDDEGERRIADLDREYLDPRIRELAELLQRPAIWDDYQAWLASA